MPPAKTERVELRLDEDTIERIDTWRQGQEDLPNRSEAIRRLLEGGLDNHTPEGFRLNNTDKLTVWMLSEILKNQIKARPDQKDAEYDMRTVKLVQEALYGGHYWALTWEMQGVMHDHVDDPKKVRLVVDILDTWRFIERGYAELSESDKAKLQEAVDYRGHNPTFLGFDGNNETEYMGIANFLVDQLNRFEHFKGRDFNSHMPTVGRYAAMARVFEGIRPSLIGRELSVGELITLLKRD